MLRMRTLAALVEHSAGLKGGALLSAIHQFARHGDPYVQTLMKHILSTVAKPIFAMLHGWVYEGVLNDAHKYAAPPPLLLPPLPSPDEVAPRCCVGVG